MPVITRGFEYIIVNNMLFIGTIFAKSSYHSYKTKMEMRYYSQFLKILNILPLGRHLEVHVVSYDFSVIFPPLHFQTFLYCSFWKIFCDSCELLSNENEANVLFFRSFCRTIWDGKMTIHYRLGSVQLYEQRQILDDPIFKTSTFLVYRYA